MESMAAKPPSTGDALGPSELDQYRSYLLRYAVLQLRDETAAEDAVQETLLAALQSDFAGRSSVKTWLTGILKHKVIDHFRRRSREQPLEDGAERDGDAEADIADDAFAEDGHWRDFPSDWNAPA